VAKAIVDQELARGRWPAQGHWTYDDYLRLPADGRRYEVLRGELYMNAAPRPRHQRALLNLIVMLANHVRAHDLGEVYVAPIDVILGALATPVQPDLLFIAKHRLAIVEEKLIRGAPDFIAEIFSPSNAKEDCGVKLDIYRQAGVGECWIVDPDARTIESFELEAGRYRHVTPATLGDTVASVAVPGFSVAVGDVCPP
jgi:Uma2 family endonuclease